MNGWEVVRARASNGDHYTTTRVRARLDGATVIEGRPARDKYGNWLPRKPHTTLYPARDDHGRFTKNQPSTGEEEA